MTDNDRNSPSIETVTATPDDSSRDQLPDTMSDLLTTAIDDVHSIDPSHSQPRNDKWKGLREHLRSVQPHLRRLREKDANADSD